MVKNFYAPLSYMVLGLLAGLFFREYTKRNDFPLDDFSQLNVLHTHLLTLGFIVFLIVLLLDAVFHLSGRKSFAVFFWTYNIGVLTTVTMMLIHGMVTVQGTPESDISPAISGIAGLGHIFITIGLMAFFVAFKPAVAEKMASMN
ncbi:DUF2871 domain-containing protein [Corynebacterium breve]|uniref:DUF2871 domain-containing protein n=1 Tax=Corynebacterium breve TaxID=3049799 RepID=A0ABY8VHP0_9CORY|nr:DUF2871 domain-containing protein [Corynebacterium breve]WIM67773.1 DUF2871 domain-containing protein [Corynebacterium breve]